MQGGSGVCISKAGAACAKAGAGTGPAAVWLLGWRQWHRGGLARPRAAPLGQHWAHDLARGLGHFPFPFLGLCVSNNEQATVSKKESGPWGLRCIPLSGT